MQTFNLNIPISKVDEEQRIVYGYATKEELDRQGDIVDYAASKKAFGAWAGNIREQHDAKRVIGKKVSMEFDDANKQILVGAYVSKSPDGENAWTKVKEGLFTGFSIGGKIKSIVKENLTKDGVTSTANRIMDYDLSELSLVDVPACPSAQFVMVKSVNGNTKEVEEMHQAPDGMALPWFTKAYAYAPDQVNYLSKSTDNESMKKESKEKSMTNEVKEVEKAVAVHAGEARDENAKDVVPEIAGMDEAEAKAHVADQKDPATAAVAVPAVEDKKVKTNAKTEEKSDKAEMKKGLYTVSQLADCVSNLTWIVSDAEWEAQFEGDKSAAVEQLKAAVTQVANALVSLTQEAVAELTVEAADTPTDLMKAVDLKLDATKQDLLKSVTDAISSKVGELITPLTDRLKALESQPIGHAPQKVYTTVEKVADASVAEDPLLAKAADMELNPHKYSGLERADLAGELLKRSSASRPIITQ
jgi:HK97 family phage prohead protease